LEFLQTSPVCKADFRELFVHKDIRENIPEDVRKNIKKETVVSKNGCGKKLDQKS
jgi:hypothetical protein